MPMDRRRGKLVPTSFILKLGDAGTTEEERWQRVVVATPGLLYPYRNNALTGSAALGSIQIAYANEMPNSEFAGIADGSVNLQAIPAGPGGACYLTTDGEWWIRVACQQAAPAAPTFLPFFFLPLFEIEKGVPPSWSWTSSTYQTLVSGQSLAAGTSVLFVTVQELLGGVRGLEVSSNTVGTNVRYRWGAAPGGNAYLPLGATFRWSEQFLPLADLYILNNGAGAITIHKGVYR
jgi:hypothetical protein